MSGEISDGKLAWKLGGLYMKTAQAAGHDSDWFLARAREYKAKGQLHNA